MSKAYLKRGNSKAILGNYQEAISDYNKAIKLNPKDGSVYYDRGDAEAKVENYKSAELDYTKVIERINLFGYFHKMEMIYSLLNSIV